MVSASAAMLEAKSSVAALALLVHFFTLNFSNA
jgi:hypothetical protein